jgi:GTP-binding protein EngB required for normal cell division
MARNSRDTRISSINRNQNCPIDKEINILLLGPTGVGKSTFINGLANYICNDTLEDAVNDQMQAVIPASFAFTDYNTDEEKTINVGESDEHESFSENGQSCTQQCRSFVFPVGNRNLRIIDAPGVGDTRGLDQDTKNFHEILTYISQYEHLNAICILLKPDEQRLNILFRFCIKELLRHLHKSASENLIFIFTNARATFFMPGATAKLLRGLLEQHEKDYEIQVPFVKGNTFLLDNEPFRYLALRRNGIQLNDEQTLSYRTSWDRTVKEYSRLMSHIVTRPLHGVRDTLSLNEAEQLIRKLTRPIAETAKLIEQNLQLAKQHKENVLKNPEIASQGLPQNDAEIVKLTHPRTVCVGENCCRLVNNGNEQKVEYTSKCHDVCYLTGVAQETINDERMRECEAINYKTGKTFKCIQSIN